MTFELVHPQPDAKEAPYAGCVLHAAVAYAGVAG